MPDDSQELQFKITTTNSGSGAKDAASDLEALTAAAKGTGSAQKDLGDETEDVETRLGGLTNEARETRHAFMELNRIFPGVGDALMGVSGEGSKTLLAVSALAVAVQVAMDAFRSYSKAAQDADEATQVLQKGIMLDAVKALADAWNQAAMAEELYRLKAAGSGKDPGLEAITRNAESIKKGFEAQKQMDETRRALAKEAIDEQERDGIISHQQVLQEKLKLDQEYEQRRMELDKQANAAEVQARQAQLEYLKSQRTTAQIGEARTAQDAEHAEAAAKANTARQKEFAEAAKQAQEAMAKSGVTPELVEKMQEAYETIFAKGGAGGYAAPGEISLQEMARFFQKNASIPFAGTAAMMRYGVSMDDAADLNRAFRNIGGLGLTPANFAAYAGGQGEAAMATKGQSAMEGKQAELDRQAAIARMEHEQDQKRLDEIDSKIAALQGPGAAPIGTSGAPVPSGFVPGTMQSPVQKARSDYDQMQAALDVVDAGKTLNDGQQEMMSEIYKMMTGHVASTEKIIQFLRTLRESQDARDAAYDRELQELNNRVFRAQAAADTHF